MDPGFIARTRKKGGRDIAAPANIPGEYFGAAACARVNEAFVIRKQRLLGARMTEATSFATAPAFPYPGGHERSNRSNNSAERPSPAIYALQTDPPGYLAVDNVNLRSRPRRTTRMRRGVRARERSVGIRGRIKTIISRILIHTLKERTRS